MALAPDWMPAAEAAKSLAHKFGGKTRAMRAIALALKENLLEARAERKACAAANGRVDLDEAGDDQGLPIPTSIRDRSLHWEKDVEAWDWESGEFRIDEEPWPGDLHVFSGVHFR